MWRGDLPKAGMEGNVPGSSQNFPGVKGVEGRSAKAGMEGKYPRSDLYHH